MSNQQELNNLRSLQDLRHSTSHLLAAAVMELWPDTKRAIGPAIENGFYFDFEFSHPISEEEFPKIENKMREILPTWKSFERDELTAEEAKKEYPNNPYKHELIDEFTKDGQKVTFYKSGNYWDLCKGGHCEHPEAQLRHFKLLSIAGAYWRGSEKNKMLTRIYGTVFPTKEELDHYLNMLEEAKKRDHKKIGPQLDLFFFDETSPGMTYWLPKGLIVYNELYSFARDMYKKYGYQEVATPQINKKGLFETSGHWQHYRADMFIAPMSYIREESKDVLGGTEVFGVKPMNCPNAMTIFKHTTRSYHDLPMRLAETTILHRFELSGTLNGLFRTRQFRQDDAHIFLYGDQIKEEFESLLKMIEEMYTPFDLTYRFRYGTRPEKFLGESKDWDTAEKSLKAVLDNSGKEYFLAPGEGAFYGPKVDILMKDTLSREWQTGTIQLDFQQPKRFGLKYTNAEGKEETPVALHRAIFGSFERFFAILLEHYAGTFPVWLSPVQVTLLPIADRHNDHAKKIRYALQKSGVRATVDERQETLKAKIRDATLQKVPYLGIIGDKEVQEGEKLSFSVRARGNKDLGQVQLIPFLQKLKEEIDKKI